MLCWCLNCDMPKDQPSVTFPYKAPIKGTLFSSCSCVFKVTAWFSFFVWSLYLVRIVFRNHCNSFIKSDCTCWAWNHDDSYVTPVVYLNWQWVLHNFSLWIHHQQVQSGIDRNTSVSNVSLYWFTMYNRSQWVHVSRIVISDFPTFFGGSCGIQSGNIWKVTHWVLI